jgi:sulfite reductase (NADPH) hemoprotein beta-component
MMSERGELSKNEGIKVASDYLRGTLAAGLAAEASGGLSEDDQQVLKFHGVYQQDDRDVRVERRRANLDKAWSFMLRVRVPGGVARPGQWLAIDRLAGEYGNGTFKLTTRQAFQLHGVIKRDLKRTVAEINRAAMDTIAACGDVNRNVMCNPNPHESALHAEVLEVAQAISDHLTPRTGAYHEIWLDGEKVATSEAEVEPVYGRTYLPRKFKITVAVPPSNDVDAFAHDLSFIAIVEGGRLAGFNVAIGGGMGMSHGQEATYPRLADVIGFCGVAEVVEVAEKVVLVQRDFGDRTDRKHARLKYTIEDRGIEWFKGEFERRFGRALEPARPFRFEDNGDRYGWIEGVDGRHHFTLYVEGGRVVDRPGGPLRTALREIAEVHDGDFRLTANQNLIIARVSPGNRGRIEGILAGHGLAGANRRSALRLHALACVALPTCGLALAESERFLPEVLDRLEETIERSGLRHDAITIRMTGCPNGCARPYLAEIGLVGKAPGKYNIYLGGGFAGQRLNKLWRAAVPGDGIAPALAPLIERYAKERAAGERFGDFLLRAGIVAETREGREFHRDVELEQEAGLHA